MTVESVQEEHFCIMPSPSQFFSSSWTGNADVDSPLNSKTACFLPPSERIMFFYTSSVGLRRWRSVLHSLSLGYCLSAHTNYTVFLSFVPSLTARQRIFFSSFFLPGNVYPLRIGCCKFLQIVSASLFSLKL